MTARIWLALSLTVVLLVPSVLSSPATACCPAPPGGKPVVNADQTVIMIWDAASQTQHFIRQASFQSEADDFGFLVPTPAEPELAESGNEAFAFLRRLTEPVTRKVPRPNGGMGCGCSSASKHAAAPASVKVLSQKLVAGFQAVVLEANSADALLGWLKAHDYAFSPEIETWAKPYIEAGWKITALKIAKDRTQDAKSVATSALRMTFKTDRPLFPYREPDSRSAAHTLGVHNRLLRIYFLAEARYRGELIEEHSWTGAVAWANQLKPEDRRQTLALLKLPETAAPAECWLTEFEDNWRYQIAPSDVYFSRDTNQNNVEREAIIQYVTSPWPRDITTYAILAVLVLAPVRHRMRRRHLATPRK